MSLFLPLSLSVKVEANSLKQLGPSCVSKYNLFHEEKGTPTNFSTMGFCEDAII